MRDMVCCFMDPGSVPQMVSNRARNIPRSAITKVEAITYSVLCIHALIFLLLPRGRKLSFSISFGDFPQLQCFIIFSVCSRYEKEGKPSELASIDIFVSTVDPLKEPPLITANTVLSILAVDYPVDKVACYVSDDGAAMLTFEALSETAEFSRRWVPFCKKYSIEPRAPEWYFSQKIDYLKNKVHPEFVRERRAMKVVTCFTVLLLK